MKLKVKEIMNILEKNLSMLEVLGIRALLNMLKLSFVTLMTKKSLMETLKRHYLMGLPIGKSILGVAVL